MSAERDLASFVAQLEPDDLPADVRDRAGLTVADTVGAIVAGSTDDDVQSLARTWSDSIPGAATVLGTGGHKMAPHFAAFCNATAGTALELDEGNRFAAGHPAAHVLPAAIADGEARSVGSETFLVSFVAGYEAAVRVARALGPLREGYHPHGVWGPVGGAAAVARLRKLDLEATRSAMAIAANFAQHTRFEAATEGATVRNSYAGMSNLASLVAVDQAEAGVTGLDDGIARHLSLAATELMDVSSLSSELESRWEITNGYFKIHAACRYTHPALDAITALELDADPATIESVLVETYPVAARLTGTRPQNRLQAKFSIPFAVATALLTGETGPPAFEAEAITPEANALAERVSVVVDDAIAARAPEQRGARVTVKTSDEEVTETVKAPLGGEHNPLSEEQIETKFESLVAPILGDERATAAWESGRALAPPQKFCDLASK